MRVPDRPATTSGERRAAAGTVDPTLVDEDSGKIPGAGAGRTRGGRPDPAARARASSVSTNAVANGGTREAAGAGG